MTKEELGANKKAIGICLNESKMIPALTDTEKRNITRKAMKMISQGSPGDYAFMCAMAGYTFREMAYRKACEA